MSRIEVIDFTKYLVTGDLVEGGAQYGPAVDTTTQNVESTVQSFTIQSPMKQLPATLAKFNIIEMEFNLVHEIRAVSTGTADVEWRWEVRDNKSSTWIDLQAAFVDEADVGTTYVSQVTAGFFPPQSGAQFLPLDVRLIFKCDEANEGRARVANTSWVRTIARFRGGE